MKMFFMNMKGEIFHATFSQISNKVNSENTKPLRFNQKRITVTWDSMNNCNEAQNIDKEVYDVLIKYGLPCTVFNCSNLQKYGYVQLPEYYKNVTLKNGAVIKI